MGNKQDQPQEITIEAIPAPEEADIQAAINKYQEETGTHKKNS
jgi:hypothetical protein